LNDGTPINYGFALWGQKFAGHDAWAHSGSDAGFRSMFAYFPAEDFSVSILANHPPQNLDGLVNALVDIYLHNTTGGLKAHEPAAVAADPALSQELAGSYVDPYEPLVALEQHAGGLRWKVASAQPRDVVFRSDGTIDVAGTSRSWAYFVPQRDADGRVVALENRAATHYRSNRILQRIRPVSPSPQELSELIGSYRSSELDVVYTLAVEHSQLMARTIWSSQAIVFIPSTRDRFDSERYSLEVLRDSLGHCVGFHLHGDRVRHVLFAREPAN
jgi:hypothetical protein